MQGRKAYPTTAPGFYAVFTSGEPPMAERISEFCVKTYLEIAFRILLLGSIWRRG